MIKEIFLAILLGALLGFGVTGVYVSTQKNKKSTSNITPIPTITTNIDSTNNAPIPTTVTTDESPIAQNSDLSITTPKNESIVSSSKIEIKGTASPNSLIVINSPNSSYQLRANDKGLFSQEIELESGPNNIQIDSFDPSDKQSTTNLQVTYSTAKI